MAAGLRRRNRAALARVVVGAAVPMGVTWLAETMLSLPVPALVRLLTALPLGAAVAAALVMLAGTDRSNRID
jgi:hypothetical protein